MKNSLTQCAGLLLETPVCPTKDEGITCHKK